MNYLKNILSDLEAQIENKTQDEAFVSIVKKVNLTLIHEVEHIYNQKFVFAKDRLNEIFVKKFICKVLSDFYYDVKAIHYLPSLIKNVSNMQLEIECIKNNLQMIRRYKLTSCEDIIQNCIKKISH